MIKNVIFDFGGVLMDWDPKYFYKSYFNDDEKMNFFLENIATLEWNGEQDRGRSLENATESLVEIHPEWENEIKAFYDNWVTMLKGEIVENVTVLRQLEGKYLLFGLTNWSDELFPYALKHYDFFELFEGKIVVSGTEKLIKPNAEIWHVLLERYNLKPEESVFIDDNAENIRVAKSLGFETIHITENVKLEKFLKDFGLKF